MQRPEGGLDGQFEKLVGQLSVLALSQPRAVKLRVQAWITKLREPTSNTVWKRNRNLYCALMLAQLQQGRLELPFTATPPDGALPNLPNHLAYRGLSPSRAAGNPRSRSSSPGGSAPRSGSPCGQAQQPQGHQLAACQLKGLVNTFQSNMQARGFDLSRPLASSKAASGAVPPKTAGALVSVGGRAAGGGALGTRGSSAGGVSLGRPCSRGRSLGRSVSSGSGVPGGAGKSGAWGDGGQRDQEHEPCLAWGETAAGDESYNDQDKVAAALLEAKEAEIAARVAAKRRQELEQRLQAEEAAKQQQRQRSAAAKAHLDAVITRYSEARQQWASPRGAGSPKTALGGRSAEPRTDAGAANWTAYCAGPLSSWHDMTSPHAVAAVAAGGGSCSCPCAAPSRYSALGTWVPTAPSMGNAAAAAPEAAWTGGGAAAAARAGGSTLHGTTGLSEGPRTAMATATGGLLIGSSLGGVSGQAPSGSGCACWHGRSGNRSPAANTSEMVTASGPLTPLRQLLLTQLDELQQETEQMKLRLLV